MPRKKTLTMHDFSVGDVSKNVLIGKDGYLFLHQGGQRQFDYLIGALNPTSESVSNFHGNLKRRMEWCEDFGALYKHVVFPSKPVLCRDKLPEKFLSAASLFNRVYKGGRAISR